MSAPMLNDDFRDLIASLVRAGADFIIVGAHALAVHGVPRATGDLDVLVRPTDDNSARVFRALIDFGAPVQAHGIRASDFAKPDVVYQIGVPPGRIDILTSISGVLYDDASADHVDVEIDGHRIAFLGRATMIKNKLAAGRDKDLVDAKLLSQKR